MTVPASKRLQCQDDFILGLHSEQFLIWIIQFVANNKNVPKKFYQTIGQSLISDATEINDGIFMANKCQLFNQNQFKIRNQLQSKCKIKLEAIIRKMSVLYKILPIKQKKVMYFVDKLCSLRKEIINWQNSDLKRINERKMEK